MKRIATQRHKVKLANGLGFRVKHGITTSTNPCFQFSTTVSIENCRNLEQEQKQAGSAPTQHTYKRWTNDQIE